MGLEMKAATLLLTLLITIAAMAQRSLGELLDQGGRRLEKAELVSLISGSTWQHPFYPGELTHKPDGKYTGTVQDTRYEKQVGVFGRWEVKDDGVLCEQSEGRYAEATPVCRSWFVQGERYFASPQASDGTRGSASEFQCVNDAQTAARKLSALVFVIG